MAQLVPVITLPQNWDTDNQDHDEPQPRSPTDLIFANYIFTNDPNGRYAAYLTQTPDLGILHCLRFLRPYFLQAQKSSEAKKQQFLARLDEFIAEFFYEKLTDEQRQMYSFRLEHNRLLSAHVNPLMPPHQIVGAFADFDHESHWCESDTSGELSPDITLQRECTIWRDADEYGWDIVNKWSFNVRHFLQMTRAHESILKNRFVIFTPTETANTIDADTPGAPLTVENLEMWNASSREVWLQVGPYTDDRSSDAYCEHEYI
ncbi:hypothetical protein BDZ89DRAFT_1138405 [Hymenopellis radicata]|nr:hypothetical protein BDZ89DRAFT_1138405 [Hymenopellis radicata]